LRWCRPKSCPADAVRIKFAPLPEKSGPGRAYAFDGSRIEIDYARITAGRTVEEGAAVLAHIPVHEVTHLVQGCDHHSTKGIMKASWNRGEIERMAREPLRFTELDIELIHAGAERRPGALVSLVK
jgi:hypothetical protein